jgi:transmembrane sensor
MERNKEEINKLIDRYLLGDCTAEEVRVVNSYFNQVAEQAPDRDPVEDIEQRKQRIWKRMNIDPPSARSTRPIFRYVAAAVILLVSGWAIFSIYQPKNAGSAIVNIQSGKTDIQPGGFGATLTLADGRKIDLDSSKSGIKVGQAITYDDGSTVLDEKEIRSSGVSFLAAKTVKGQTYSFTLSDGTKVWLNADSKLTFPSRFVGGKRKVVLEGEGYFVVKHQINNPFFVESKGQLVEDLGTEFNIQAYGDESIVKTTLVEGAVKVNTMLIKPGEQTLLSPSGKIKVEKADLFKVLAWKQGDFVFRGEPLEEVLQVIARWYDIDVKYEHESSKYITVGGTISRSKTIRSVLDMMEQTEKVKFKVSGRVITVL